MMETIGSVKEEADIVVTFNATLYLIGMHPSQRSVILTQRGS